jgi:hypothetical protein
MPHHLGQRLQEEGQQQLDEAQQRIHTLVVKSSDVSVCSGDVRGFGGYYYYSNNQYYYCYDYDDYDYYDDYDDDNVAVYR